MAAQMGWVEVDVLGFFHAGVDSGEHEQYPPMIMTFEPPPMSAEDRAQLRATLEEYSNGLQRYVAPQGMTAMPLIAPLDYLTGVLGYNAAEAEALIARATQGEGVPMTEAEWLCSDGPRKMLDMLLHRSHPDVPHWKTPSERKLRLFACACARQCWEALDERTRKAVEVAELYADGGISEAYWNGVRAERGRSFSAVRLLSVLNGSAAEAALYTARYAVEYHDASAAIQASLLREIVGNPRQPVRLLVRQSCAPGCTVASNPPLEFSDGKERACGACLRLWERPWLTPTVTGLAETIYATQDYGLMPMLWDALETAGCQDEGIREHCQQWHQPACVHCKGEGKTAIDYRVDTLQGLEHCRDCHGTGLAPRRQIVHARGCHLIDTLLGKQ